MGHAGIEAASFAKRCLRLLTLLAVPMLVASCGGRITAQDHANLPQALEGKTIAITERPPTPFASESAATALAGVFGTAGRMAAGKALVEKYDLPDPSVLIKSTLLSHFVQRYRMASQGTRIAVETNTPAINSDAEVIARQTAGRAAYVIDVKSFNWILQSRFAITSPRIMTFGANARLIDAASGEVVLASQCSFATGIERSEYPTFEELVSNNGALLKDLLLRTVDECNKILIGDMIGAR